VLPTSGEAATSRASRAGRQPGGGCAIGAVAAAFAAGIAAGWAQPRPFILPWLAAAAGLLILATALHLARRTGPAFRSFVLAVAALGAAWMAVRGDLRAPDSLAAVLGGRPGLAHLRGTVVEPPRRRAVPEGSLGRFDHRPPPVLLGVEVEALFDRHGARRDVRGRVIVSVDEQIGPLVQGDLVEARGTYFPPRPPVNPGERDRPRLARCAGGGGGTLVVPARDLLRPIDRQPRDLWRGALRLRGAVQRRAAAWLGGDVAGGDPAPREVLLAALLLGVREDGYEELGGSFTRVGLAHLMAISGLHLGITAGFFLVLVRRGGPPQRWHGWMVIGAIAVYLVAVEVRVPVLRAGLMTAAASLGMAMGRHMRIEGLVAASALLLLAVRPDQLLAPGFQLSYGVVLGLVLLGPRLRRRWFGPPRPSPANARELCLERLKSATAVAVTAWIVALPITLHHFGMVNPLAVPLSVVGVPLAAVVLVLGSARMMLAPLLPSAAMIIDWPLDRASDVLLHVVWWCERLPGSTLRWPPPPAAWMILALAWVWMWATGPGGRRRRGVLWLSFLVLAAWLAWPLVPLWRPALRADMLAVGNGTCILVRSGTRAALFDAGSSGRTDIGGNVIAPALRALGVRRLDFVAISHANIDHYAGVIEVTEELAVSAVLITPQFLEEAEADPGGPAAFLLATLEGRGLAIECVAAGATRRLGRAAWSWIHPPAGYAPVAVNDSSMVIRVEAAGRRLLLCGDIEGEAMEMVAAAPGGGATCEVMELPHHGSHGAGAAEFARGAGPRVVLQSTGATRLERDRWELGRARRLVTARDGAVWMEVDGCGRVTCGAWGPTP
jgi:competence protein ComEC